MDITFRPLADGDLPMLHGWLNEPGVVRWWEGDDVTWLGVVKDYGPGRSKDCEHFVALLDGRPFGWIQCCDQQHPDASREDDEYEVWRAAGVPTTAAGIDYLVAEPSARGTGLGSQMIARFTEDVVFAPARSFTHAVASPQVANEASWRALAKAGFTHLADHDDPIGVCRIMVRPRD